MNTTREIKAKIKKQEEQAFSDTDIVDVIRKTYYKEHKTSKISKFSRNKYYTPEEYKNMEPMKLIELYKNLINALCNKFSDNGRLAEDIKQELYIELLRLQKEYDASKGTHFSAYINGRLIGAATKARQKHFGSIYVQYTSAQRITDRGEPNPIFTDDIDNHKENIDLYYNETKAEDNMSFTVIKLILIAIKNSELSEVKKQNLKVYLRKSLNGGKISAVLVKALRPLLEKSVLKNYFK